MSLSLSTEEIVSAISPRSMQVIAIDGFQASGKTTLARSLATHWNLQVISADDYLNRNQGGFFAHLKLEELSDSLQKTTPCIFEGLCALQILEAVELSPDLMIYVKRMTIQGGWADAMEIDTSMLSSSGIVLPTQNATEPLNPLQVSLRALWEEVAQYHKLYQPHKRADVFYERRCL